MSDRRPEPTAGGIPDELIHERASATPSLGNFAKRGRAPNEKNVRHAPLALPLRELQEWFSRAVTHAGPLAAGLVEADASLPAIADHSRNLERLITSGPELAAIDRLAIYHYAYRARLVDCLVDDFPAVRYAIGAAAFDALCDDYITAHPSRSPNLVGFGKFFAGFCGMRSEAWAKFAGELAMLEWAMTEVIHAADTPALDVETLQKISPERWAHARFTPAKTLRVIRFAYPANAYFQAYREQLGASATNACDHNHAAEARAIPAREATATAVYRQGFTIWRMSLTPAMAGVLSALCEGATLGSALEGVESHVATAEDLAEAERNVMEWFTSWLAGGFFEKLDFDDP